MLLMENWKINSCRLMKPKAIWFFPTTAIMQTVKCDLFSSCSTYYSQAQLLIKGKIRPDEKQSKFWRGCKRFLLTAFFLFFFSSSSVSLNLSLLERRKFKFLSKSSRKFCRNILCHYIPQYFYLVTVLTIKTLKLNKHQLRNLSLY